MFSLVDQYPAAEAFYKNPVGAGEVVWESLQHSVEVELKYPHLVQTQSLDDRTEKWTKIWARKIRAWCFYWAPLKDEQIQIE